MEQEANLVVKLDKQRKEDMRVTTTCQKLLLGIWIFKEKSMFILVHKYYDGCTWLITFYFRFKGARQGGIAENSSYYIFSLGENNVINAYKLEEWYNFQPVSRYKTLTNSEAEEEFERYLTV